MDLSFGKNILRITAVTNTNATQFSANTALMILGKCANISGHCVNPSPMQSESIYIQLPSQIIQTTALGIPSQEY